MRKGQTLPKEAREKISAKLKGRRCSMGSEFARGHSPWNKGLKGKGICKANSGSFQKGQRPKNYMGGYKICKDGVYVRVENGKKFSYQREGRQIIIGKYEARARKIYRETFGDFDKNLIVFHKDGDVYNDEIDNLELISRGELLKRNTKPIKKDCSICGKEFSARTKHIKTCSPECSKENLKILNREYGKKYREKQRLFMSRH